MIFIDLSNKNKSYCKKIIDLVDKNEKDIVINCNYTDYTKNNVQIININDERELADYAIKSEMVLIFDINDYKKYVNYCKRVIMVLDSKNNKLSRNINKLSIEFTEMNNINDIIRIKDSKKKNKKSNIDLFLYFILITVIFALSLLSINKSETINKLNSDKNNLNKEVTNLKQINKNYTNYLFLGDSITNYYDLDKYYEGYKVVNSGVCGDQTDDILDDLGGSVATDNMKAMGEESNITELVDSIIKTAMKKRTSDIHIEPQKDEIRVRYRIDGELFVATTIAIEKLPQIVGRLKAISNMHQEIQESQDGRILLYDDYNIRVSSQRNVYGEKFVLRLLKKNNSIQSIFDLGYPGTPEDLDKSINKRNSITLIAAPTGEGKTTSLYSMLDYLNKPNINVTTIEDPVEIRIPGLNQIEVDPKSTFSDNLRTILRQDPDIILVGEIRDKETAEIAMQAGQTGHYVLSTIHTIDAVEVITRLRKIGISDYDISSTLATAISQRLVRKICPNCRKERPFNDQEKKIITSIGEKYGIKYDLDNAVTYDAVGCAKCNHSGYAGRIACFEILNLDEETKELIMNGASSIEIRKCALKGTYRPLLVDGINKVVKGITTLDELNRKLRVF